MASVLMFHSYKGGTGKSLISVNIAASLVGKGFKVALLDFDFLGPGLFTTFIPSLEDSEIENVLYLNDAFFKPLRDVSIDKVLLDMTNKTDPKGAKFYVGLANPEPSEINSMIRLSQKQVADSFRKVLLSREYIYDQLGIDYIIIDAGPGFRNDVAFAMLISDVIISVMKPSEADLEGTKRLLKSTSVFVGERIQGIIINRAVSSDANPGYPELKNLLESRQESIVSEIIDYSRKLSIPVFGTIPCLCGVSRGESHQRIIAREFPDHIFSKVIEKIIESINTEQQI